MPAARATDINAFLNRRQPNWTRLEALLLRVEQHGLGVLTAAEVREFGILYRRTSSDLVSARAKTANAEVLQYLNDLVARAYAQVYRSRRFQPQDILTFLWIDFPRLFRHAGKYIALATLISLAAVAFGWEMNHRDPAGAFYMLPPEMVKNIPTMRQMWSGRTGHDNSSMPVLMMPMLSSFLMTHNIGVGLTAFAGGIFLGIGSLWAMIQNGMMLGILGQAMTTPQTALVFWSLILPHGIVELSAIFIMGGSGFVIASALLAPGRRSRLDALIERGRLAVLLAAGGAAMLVIAGLIEAFITPPAFIPPWAKLFFAACTLVAEVLFFTLGGRGPQPGLLKELAAYSPDQKDLTPL